MLTKTCRTFLGSCLFSALLFSGTGATQEIMPSNDLNNDEQPVLSLNTALQADLDNGSTIYDNACSACHGEFGQGGQDGGPALTGNLSLAELMNDISDGTKTMPAFDVFTEQELLDISTFVAERM